MSDHGPEIDATDARQGRKGKHVLAILIVSLTLIVGAFVALYAIKVGPLSGRGGQARAPASATQALDAAPSSTQSAGQPTH